MVAPDWIRHRFDYYADGLCARLPQRVPPPEKLRGCRIISHRGEHDNRGVLENTRAAFDAVVQSGVWGMEFDLRWTRDLQPVVFHDRDCRRIFRSPTQINQVTWRQLQARFPLILPLQEVVRRYGKKIHLMVELKAEPYPEVEYQNQVLAEAFSALVPQQDYHFLALDPGLFERIHFLPRQTFVPVAELNLGELSRKALDQGYGGIAGHYLFVTPALVRKHHEHHQRVGTGFIASAKCLYREINRGADWIFTNRALYLQRICDNLSRSQTE
jgi:glycerophosphoryl diester phosphodiesterase